MVGCPNQHPAMSGRGDGNVSESPLPIFHLSDSHIENLERGSEFDRVEFGESDTHDLWAGLAIVAGPTAQPSDDPGREGQGSLRMWIALALGLALEPGRDSLDNGLIVRIEG